MNTLAISILFIGYFFAVGTGVIVNDSFKYIFRVVSLLIFLVNIFYQRAIDFEYFLFLISILFIFAINESLIAINIGFLLLMSASMRRMSGKEVAVSLFLPTMIVVGLHLILLTLGLLAPQVTEFGGRTRSALGFANANQASAIYMSFVMLGAFTHLQFRNRVSFLMMVLSYAAAFICNTMTDTRTSMAALVLLLMFQTSNFFFLQLKVYRAFLVLFGAVFPFLGSIATYYLVVSNDFDLDVLLSMRPSVFSVFIDMASTYDLFFGWAPVGGAGVDNFYLMLLSGIGGIGYFFTILMISLLIFRMNSGFIPFVIVLLTISVFEAFLLRPEIPISALFIYLLQSGLSRRSTTVA